ncbi:MAG: cytochrome C [Phycisphaerales bacterium JB039]
MSRLIRAIIGPRVPESEMRRRGWRYAAPTVALSAARILLLISLFLPYWTMTLEAPQYPDDLRVQAYLNRLTGDVREIDGLNHYIGMRPLEDAAQLERSLSIAGLIALILLVEGATYIHTRWAALMALPAIVFPAFFLGDLWFWLHNFGQNLDPQAPLSSAIKPFTPPVLGVGVIGQFKTVAAMGPGLILAIIASGLTIVGLWLHRRAYKPLVEAGSAEEAPE